MNPSTLYKSLFFEIAAIASIFLDTSFNTLLIFFSLHLIASFFISQVLVALMPKQYKKNFNFTLFFITLLNTATIFLGYFGSFYLCTVLLRRTKKTKNYQVEDINTFQLMFFPKIKRQLGEGAAKIGSIGKVPKDLKLKILETFLNDNSQEAVRVFKNFLSDEDREVRLYSFQAINRIKSEINRKIDLELDNLEKTDIPLEKAQSYKKLAFYYSYMFKMELNDEILMNFFIEKSLYFINLAKEIMSDEEILFLEAEIRFIRREFELAEDLLLKALKYGMDGHKVYPLLAEIYFEKKEFNKIKEILTKDFSLKLDYHTQPITELWESN